MPSPLTVEQQSDEPTNWEVPVDHERLRYVTRLLGSQQGLNTALVGMLLLLAEISNPGGWWDLLALPASLLGIKIYLAASERWIPAYYQQRFGSVQATRKPWSKWDALLFLAFLVLLFVWIFFGQPIAHYLDPMASRLHILISLVKDLAFSEKDKKMRTTASLSKRGISEIADYWKTMDEIRAQMAQEKKRRAPVRNVPRPGLTPEPAT